MRKIDNNPPVTFLDTGGSTSASGSSGSTGPAGPAGSAKSTPWQQPAAMCSRLVGADQGRTQGAAKRARAAGEDDNMQDVTNKLLSKINLEPTTRTEFKRACRRLEEPAMRRYFTAANLSELGDAVRHNYVAHMLERCKRGATLAEYHEARGIYELVAKKQVELFDEIKRNIEAMENRAALTTAYNELFDDINQTPGDSIDLEIAQENVARLRQLAAQLDDSHVAEAAYLHDCVHHNWAVAFLDDKRFSIDYRFRRAHTIYSRLDLRDEELFAQIETGYKKYCLPEQDGGGKTPHRRKATRPVRNGIRR